MNNITVLYKLQHINQNTLPNTTILLHMHVILNQIKVVLFTCDHKLTKVSLILHIHINKKDNGKTKTKTVQQHRNLLRLGRLNNNQKIDYRKFFSLSFSFVHSRLSNFNMNDTGHSSEEAHVARKLTVTASYQCSCSQGLVQENVCGALLAANHTTAGCPPDSIINTSVL